jgi:hypothetical protein
MQGRPDRWRAYRPGRERHSLRSAIHRPDLGSQVREGASDRVAEIARCQVHIVVFGDAGIGVAELRGIDARRPFVSTPGSFVTDGSGNPFVFQFSFVF